MSDEPLFTTLDASTAQGDLMGLVNRTSRGKGRIEITNGDGACCVLISKDELVSLEDALEILARTDGAKAIERTIERFAMLTEGPAGSS